MKIKFKYNLIIVLILMASSCSERVYNSRSCTTKNSQSGLSIVKKTQKSNWENSVANWKKNDIEQAKAYAEQKKEEAKAAEELAKHEAKIAKIKGL